MFEFLKRFRKKKVDSGNSINTIKSDLSKTGEYTPPYTTSSVLRLVSILHHIQLLVCCM